MASNLLPKRFSRRTFFKAAGGTLIAAAGAGLGVRLSSGVLRPVQAVNAQEQPPDMVFGATDGWISLPASPALAPFHPDPLAPAPFTTYMFGFRNLTGMTAEQISAQKEKVQHSAPMISMREGDVFRLKLLNLGFAIRPDLVDTHTVHWHGFKNAIPFFDGEPSSSISVPIGRDFTYVYHPHDPGTYMFHCHVEDVEHVHMGMTGMVFVHPAQDGNTSLYPSGKYAYNDGDGSTGYDREFAMIMSEVWAEAHWADAHIQLPEWSDYRPDFCLLNGRTYPDTVAPNGAGPDPVTGDLIPTPGFEHLQYQPNSSLITCNAGERVLVRLSNLGFTYQSMKLSGLKLRVVGKDATHLRGRDGTDQSYLTGTISIGPGESVDSIFEAPAYQGPGEYDTYLLYNRNFKNTNNLQSSGYGGQMTEVRVYPAGVLPPQSGTNM